MGFRDFAEIEADHFTIHTDGGAFCGLAEEATQSVRQRISGQRGHVGGTGNGLFEVVDGEGNDHAARVKGSGRVCRVWIRITGNFPRWVLIRPGQLVKVGSNRRLMVCVAMPEQWF
jgi:hypothetical protein